MDNWDLVKGRWGLFTSINGIMKKIILIGAGGHAAEIRDYIDHHNETSNKNNKILVLGFLDDDESKYLHYDFNEPYLGSIQNHDIQIDVQYLIAIANLKYRRPIIETFQNKGAKFTGFIHPTCQISSSAEIHPTSILSHRVSVGPKVRIGAFNVINSRCTIGHDTIIGDYNFISPLVALSGNTKIGDVNMIGTNAVTIPFVKIGNQNIIGAGTVLFKEVGDSSTIVLGSKPRKIN